MAILCTNNDELESGISKAENTEQLIAFLLARRCGLRRYGAVNKPHSLINKLLERQILLKNMIKEGNSFRLVPLFVIISAVLFGIASIMAFLFTDAPLIDVISVIATSTLYAILVIMYEQQKSLQEQQTEIQEKQANLKSLEYTPHIRRKDWSESHHDVIELEIKNIGKGYASDLMLESRAKCVSSVFQLKSYRIPLYRIKGDKIEKQKSDLEPGELGNFLTYVGISMESDTSYSDTHSPFTCAVNKIATTKHTLVEWELDIIYTNALGEESSETILSTTFDSSRGLSLTEAFHNLHENIEAARFDATANRLKRNSELGWNNTEKDQILDSSNGNPSIEIYGPNIPVRRDPLQFPVGIECDLGQAERVDVYVSGEKIASFDEENEDERFNFRVGDEEDVTKFGSVIQSVAVIDDEEYKLDCQSIPDAPPDAFHQRLDLEDLSKSIGTN